MPYRLRIPSLVSAVLIVASAACGSGSGEETFSDLDQTGVTRPPPIVTDITVGTQAPTTTTRPVETTTADETDYDFDLPDLQPAYIGEVEVMIQESFPPQVSVVIKGEHPTPCHATATDVIEGGGTFEIMVWSELPDPDVVCAAVLEPFEEVVRIGEGFEPGDYVVTVNGEPHPFTI